MTRLQVNLDDTTFLKALEGEATEELQAIRAYRVYQGNNPDYAKRAKLAIGVIGAYVRLRATIANEHSNELISYRLFSGRPQDPPKLPAKCDTT